MSDIVKLPFRPDYFIVYPAYKHNLCDLCEKEKTIDMKFDNKNCPHCSKKTNEAC